MYNLVLEVIEDDDELVDEVDKDGEAGREGINETLAFSNRSLYILNKLIAKDTKILVLRPSFVYSSQPGLVYVWLHAWGVR